MNDKRVYISPSILNANVHDLENEIKKISSSADFLHLDIMDNIFVPNFTFTLEQSEKILKYTSLPVDAHLMVANPDFLAPQYAQIGCFSVTFHFEAAKNPKEIIQNIVSNGARAAIAIKPSTPFESIEKFLPDIYMLCVRSDDSKNTRLAVFEGQLADAIGNSPAYEVEMRSIAFDNTSKVNHCVAATF